MKARFASMFLLLVLFGGAFAGVPLNFGESECSMNGMMDMDCCKAALLQGQATKVSEAELLCALNCAEKGTTLPSSGLRVTQPSAMRVAPHPVAIMPSFGSVFALRLHRFKDFHDPPGSPPAYLRNLALLI